MPVTRLATTTGAIRRLIAIGLQSLGLLDFAKRQETRAGRAYQTPRRRRGAIRQADVIVSHIEVNEKHGVGVLLLRLFGGHPNLISVRSQSHHGGDNCLSALSLQISHGASARDGWFANVLDAMGDHTIRRIVCVPYFEDDVRTAIALREIYNAKLCTYLMDDQNICVDGISDELVGELLEKSDLRLAISPELVTEYGLKYSCPIHLLPPVVSSEHLLTEVTVPTSVDSEPRAGVMIGNIWGQHWLDQLRQTIRESGVVITWHSNDHFRYLAGDSGTLAKDGIRVPDGAPLSDGALVRVLRNAPFAVVPTGTLDEADDRQFIARLSLPSRIPLILASSHTPLVVVGSEKTGAARFVKDLGIGTVCPYDQQAFVSAVEWITQPDVNQTLREHAAAKAGTFSADGVAEWIWESLARGEPIDRRYEEFMPRSD